MQTNEQSNHHTRDPILSFFNRVIAQVARVLAAIMAIVIIWGVADVVYVLYQRLMAPPFMLLEIKDILATFGAFMAVLIAIEIFHNIILYIEDDTSHNRQQAVEIVLGTALMAIARKVIILDFNEVGADHVYATAAVTLALSVGYYLIVIRAKSEKSIK
ncbi:MAG TPA: phosphate-starvation-inducible PsiE family protein [Accumulibacter sp.]|nr:phosphate-starvation-inducible PsiE family protein [Accumulibacter sp.]HMW16653.1 phosphate-starvation-inducible PsiE family protein [Accumulibacter sp.]HMX23454.1 phosphate-starvation-inducible PsiE family protein [Accumulibacter sp.]HNC17704.1 phosphate-starvation-inducible PsiE family protein [Accumulibacter sp.]HND79398.1 phosphate-starvation-inducible PsiE family protein [Accumulibacter sp.]